MGGRAACSLARARQESPREHRHVERPVAQRRNEDRGGPEAPVHVLPEAPLGHLALEIRVGRREDAHVDRALHDRTHAARALGLQHAQQLGLHAQRALANLVEQHRAPVRGLEQPRLHRARVRERALLVSEQLALEEVLGDRGAVERHERPVLARRPRVQGLRDELLADARLARDEQRQIRRREPPRLGVEAPHGRIGDEDGVSAGLQRLGALRDQRHPCAFGAASRGARTGQEPVDIVGVARADRDADPRIRRKMQDSLQKSPRRELRGLARVGEQLVLDQHRRVGRDRRDGDRLAAHEQARVRAVDAAPTQGQRGVYARAERVISVPFQAHDTRRIFLKDK